MMSTAARAGGLVGRAVAEAIDAVAVRSVREKVIALALRADRRSDIPERGPEVRDFVDGALRNALETTLGADVAVSVCDELAPVVELVSEAEVSEIRPSWPALLRAEDDDDPELTIEFEEEPLPATMPPVRAPRPLVPTNPAPRELPLLLVASSDPSSVGRLGHALGGVAFLEPVRDALSMLEAFGRGDTKLIVLDCVHPSVRAETLLAMQPELPEGARVVLWGEAPELERQLATLGDGLPDTWVLCGPNASAPDVAAVCRVLLS
jgi:hypothetical protein